MAEGDDVLEFGDAELDRPRHRKTILAVAGLAVAGAAIAATMLTVTAGDHPPPQTGQRSLVRYHGVYLQEMSNGAIVLPASARFGGRPLRLAFHTAGR